VLSKPSTYRVAVDRGATLDVLGPDGHVMPFTNHCSQRPVVGDEIVVDEASRRIVAILPRRSWIARQRADGTAQFVAANVTAGLVVTSPERREFSPRRVARYLVALRAGRVEPAVILNKCEEAADLGALLGALRAVAGGAAVLPISALRGTHCETLELYLRPGATLALCGSSGVGKSTLLNRLIGCATMTTNPTREDGRGRHTTSFRRLVLLRNGAAVIDTPGMRAFSAWAAAGQVDELFSDVTDRAARCRFTDCTHSCEPGCAVLREVPSERIEQWRKLRREAEWLASREDAAFAAERKRRWKRIHKAVRAATRLSGKP
jgi:ribosome biogenesis GTPase / thiamine phosphate phosphatase